MTEVIASEESEKPKQSPVPRSIGRSLWAAAPGLLGKYGLVLAFAVVMLVFTWLAPKTFLGPINMKNTLTFQSVTALLALAVMLPLATNEFDLSLGYHVGMAQVLVIGLQVNQNLSWEVAVLIVLLVGLLVGTVNAILVTRFHINSFIATLGSGMLLYAISNWYTGGMQIVPSSLPEPFTGMVGQIAGIPIPALVVVALSVVLWLVLERTVPGRGLYVIGSSRRAAELTGISIPKHVGAAFIGCGVITGLAGVFLGSMLRTGTASEGPEFLLPALAGALLGATSIHPGRVNVIGTLVAVLILAFAFSGVQQLGAPFYTQYLFNGGILIVAVGLSGYASRRNVLAAARRAPVATDEPPDQQPSPAAEA